MVVGQAFALVGHSKVQVVAEQAQYDEFALVDELEPLEHTTPVLTSLGQ